MLGTQSRAAPAAARPPLPEVNGRRLAEQPPDQARDRCVRSVPPQCALPDDGDAPAPVLELPVLPLVPLHVRPELLLPEPRTGCWGSRIRAIGMPVPVAAVNHADRRVPRQNEVGAARQRPDMESIAKTRGVKRSTKRQLRSGVLALDPGHHPGTNFGADDVSHQGATAPRAGRAVSHNGPTGTICRGSPRCASLRRLPATPTPSLRRLRLSAWW